MKAISDEADLPSRKIVAQRPGELTAQYVKVGHCLGNLAGRYRSIDVARKAVEVSKDGGEFHTDSIAWRVFREVDGLQRWRMMVEAEYCRLAIRDLALPQLLSV